MGGSGGGHRPYKTKSEKTGGGLRQLFGKFTKSATVTGGRFGGDGAAADIGQR